MPFDQKYCDRMYEACMRALVTASIDPTTNVSYLRNDEIADALISIIAVCASTSKGTATSRGTRAIAEMFRKRLINLIGSWRAEYAKNGAPFPVKYEDED